MVSTPFYTEFQFHNGSIKGMSNEIVCIYCQSFNSTMVRLKGGFACPQCRSLSMFQFHNGSIKGSEFQFHNGSIKGGRCTRQDT